MSLNFAASNFIAASFFAVASLFIWRGQAKWPESWRTLPRNRYAGVCLGVLCLVWSSAYVLPMLEGSLARFQPAVRLLIPVGAVLSFLYLNFLFARALGGLFILGGAFLIAIGFAHGIPVRPLYSVVCYLMAGGGMILVAAPWHLRDVLERTNRSAKWRLATASTLGSFALFHLIFALAAWRT